MVIRVLLALGVILIVLGILALLGIFTVGTAPASTLIVVGCLLLISGWVLGRRTPG